MKVASRAIRTLINTTTDLMHPICGSQRECSLEQLACSGSHASFDPTLACGTPFAIRHSVWPMCGVCRCGWCRVVLGCLAAAPAGAQVDAPPRPAAAALKALTMQALWRLLLAARASGHPAAPNPSSSPARRRAEARAEVGFKSNCTTTTATI